MPTFPTLSQKPSIDGWGQKRAKDPTVRTDMENGFEQTYPAFTRKTKEWPIVYKALPTADMELIEAHEDSVNVGSQAFDWVNPADNVTYSVRFTAPVDYKLHDNSSNLWDVNFMLRQV